MIEIGDFPQQDHFAPQGWVCPKCGRVYAPSTPMCWYCGNKTAINQTTTSAKPVNFDEYLQRTNFSSITAYNSFKDSMINNKGD